LTYTFLGGFWAVSVTDTIQGLLMFFSAILLPAAGILALGGIESLWSGLVNYSAPDFFSVSGAHIGWAAAGMILGTMGIGLGWTGQPHIMVRYMA
ncbi:MAG: sodium/proline symporter, partial [Gammaproteobacteria bacterium]|nr:sodium/proline symporter [Gammaproteobacteria bacterium]NIO61343.1 sodium/proline symporter [Gammaproteobacteria bacterium]